MDRLGSSVSFIFEGFRLDCASGGLVRTDGSGNTEPVALGSRALGVLALLVERQGELVSKEEIFALVWPGTVVGEGNLTVQISALRRVLDHGRTPRSCIQTIPGRGYRFIPAVTRTGEVQTHARRGQAAMEQEGAAAGSAVLPDLSIVVLPFLNLSNDPEQEYFADGITDDLTTDLSRISDILVIARTTAFTYKGKSADAKKIGRELGVRYVLEGSVRRTGDQVQINVQLIDAETRAHVWADRFDTNRSNLAEAQSEIIGGLARMLNTEVILAVGRVLENEKAVNPDARDRVMRGLALWHRPVSAANRREARRAFEMALEIDPKSVDAQIGLARVFAANVLDGVSRSAETDKARAEELLLEVFERGAKSSRGHDAMGLLRWSQNRLSEAKAEFEMAITLDRNNAWALSRLGTTLMYLGQPEAGIPLFEKANRLDPRSLNVALRNFGLGFCHLLLGRVDKAIHHLRMARAENSWTWYIHLILGGALGLNGDLDEARGEVAASLKLNPDINSVARAHAVFPWITNPNYMALEEKTLVAGLRRVGFT